jgi:hypothetical protein
LSTSILSNQVFTYMYIQSERGREKDIDSQRKIHPFTETHRGKTHTFKKQENKKTHSQNERQGENTYIQRTRKRKDT